MRRYITLWKVLRHSYQFFYFLLFYISFDINNSIFKNFKNLILYNFCHKFSIFNRFTLTVKIFKVWQKFFTDVHYLNFWKFHPPPFGKGGDLKWNCAMAIFINCFHGRHTCLARLGPASYLYQGLFQKLKATSGRDIKGQFCPLKT